MKKVLIAIFVVLVLVAAYYLVSPLFTTDEVNESFPTQPTINQQMDESDRADSMVQVPTDEELEQMSPEAKKSVEESIVRKMEDLPPTEVNEEMNMEASNEPVLLASGEFSNADSFHKGSGKARVYQLPDGSDLLRLEDFEVTNGPDLFVYLATDASASNFVDLGALKGNKGNQNYAIPAGTDLTQYDTVLIWCRAFSVLFSPAELTAVAAK